MHPVLEALRTLGGGAGLQPENEQLAPTVAVALDDGEQPLERVFAEARTLLEVDGLRLLALRTLTLLIERRYTAAGSAAADADAVLFDAYQRDVAWPVLGRSAARGASHREACVCLRELAERAGLSVKVLPSISEVLGAGVRVQDLRDINLEDLLGRRVAFVASPERAGEVSVVLDLARVPAGLYLVRLTIGDRVEVRPLTIVR